MRCPLITEKLAPPCANLGKMKALCALLASEVGEIGTGTIRYDERNDNGDKDDRHNDSYNDGAASHAILRVRIARHRDE